MSRELLHCPFCGGDAEMDTRRPYRALRGAILDEVAIYCLGCGVDLSMDPHEVNVERDILAEQMAEAWNRRFLPAQVIAMRGLLVEALAVLPPCETARRISEAVYPARPEGDER